jgi:hypothetical protein
VSPRHWLFRITDMLEGPCRNPGVHQGLWPTRSDGCCKTLGVVSEFDPQFAGPRRRGFLLDS